MEWNARPPLQWDWENLTVLSPRMTGHENKLHSSNFQYKHGMNFISFDSAGKNSIGYPYSELGQASPGSSKSVSVTSSSLEESRSLKFTIEGLENFGSKMEFVEAKVPKANTYAMLETSICSRGPMFGRKLGKPVYFEDATAGNHTKRYFSVMQSKVTRKRCKSVCQSTLSLHCQVEGCNVELSNVKDYYRKHRVCESHSKSPKVVIGGIERRFCQQCSRFHCLSEFDEKKRSCRRRLSNHNARRRKQQLNAISLDPASHSSLDFESQQLGLFSDELSVVYPRPNAYLTMGATFGSKGSQCRKNDSRNLLPTATKVLDTGLEVGNMNYSNLHTSHEFQRALSLLSNCICPLLH